VYYALGAGKERRRLLVMSIASHERSLDDLEGRSPMLNPPGIGIISTIGYRGTNLETKFREGVNNKAWCDAADPLDGRGYDKKSLADAVTSFNNNPAVGLIVTVGGVAPAVAALRNSTKPFLSLVGGTIADFPGTIAGKFCGGLTLETFVHNNERFDHLTGSHGKPSRHHFTANQVCLLINPDTACADDEMGLWPSPPRGKIFKARNDREITQAFTDFQQDNTLRAIVVSADPFLQDHKDILIAAANASNKHVCYPLHIYANTGKPHRPTPGRHTLHGPKLATAYHALGEKAAAVVRNNGTPSTLDPVKTEIQEG
jgi:hypothetical protein